jgi:ABC-2 type transport system ATP-binding protein
VIKVDGLAHAFGHREVLRGMDLSVEAGEVVGLVGPNGAGKTTLLRLLVTLLPVQAGKIVIAGHDVRSEPGEVRRAVGYLPERGDVYTELTVWEYLDLFAGIGGVPRADADARIEDALARQRLTDRRDELAGQLSKGLRQRLALQAALIHSPRLLVLDEPTDGLDPPTREAVYDEIRRFARAGGAALVSSHALEEIERAADRVLLLVHGQVDKSPEEAARFVVRVRGDLQRARDLAAALPTVLEVRAQDGCLVVTPRAPCEDVAALAAALVREGFDLLELRPAQGRLRERFRVAVEC